jgi:Fur family iron response transcriptional regulator
MTTMRPYANALNRLKDAGLRPTRQRLALAKLLFENGTRHVTAEQLHTEAMSHNVRVSLATVYNTLHQFTEAELLREIVVDPGRSYFDTNTDQHHHFYSADDGLLQDIAADSIPLPEMPDVPEGMEVETVEVVIRLKRIAAAAVKAA